MDREFGEFTTMARRENQRPPSHQSSTVSSEKEIAADDSPSRSWIRGFGPWPKGVRFNIAWHAPRDIILRRQPWCTRGEIRRGEKGVSFRFFDGKGLKYYVASVLQSVLAYLSILRSINLFFDHIPLWSCFMRDLISSRRCINVLKFEARLEGSIVQGSIVLRFLIDTDRNKWQQTGKTEINFENVVGTQLFFPTFLYISDTLLLIITIKDSVFHIFHQQRGYCFYPISMKFFERIEFWSKILFLHFCFELEIHRYRTRTRSNTNAVTNGPLIMLMVSTYVCIYIYTREREKKKKVNIVIFRWWKAVEHPMIVFRSAKSYAICIRRA